MKTYHGIMIFALAVFVLACREPRVSRAGTWTKHAAEQWVQQNSWRHGFLVALDPSTDYVAFTTQYHLNPGLWDKAFAYLKNTNLDSLSPGKYPIQGDDLFALVTVAPTDELDKTNWESHRKYIDMHYVINGKEEIGIAPLSQATVTKPYDEINDVANYSVDGVYHLAEPTVLFLLFPTDVHRINIKVKGYDTVKKVVLKLRYTK